MREGSSWRAIATAGIGVALSFLAGCQNSNNKAQSYRDAYATGQLDVACAEIDKRVMNEDVLARRGNAVVEADIKDWGRDSVLYLLEQGTLLRAANRLEESNTAFARADRKMQAGWDRPTVELTKETQAMVENMGAITYWGYAYDQVMAKTYMGLNYMQLGDLSKARSMLYGSEVAQREYIEKRSGKIDDQNKELAKNKSLPKNTPKTSEMKNGKGQPAYSGIDNLVARYGAYQDYRNPFSTWLYGITMMATKQESQDLSTARAAIEVAAGMAPDNQTIKADLELVNAAAEGNPLPEVTYVVFETGLGPIRDDFILRLPIPVGNIAQGEIAYAKVALPTLEVRDNHVQALQVTASGQTYQTELLASMDAIVAREFKDELPLVITKSIISSVIKATTGELARREAAKQDAVAGLVVLIANVAYQETTTRADLRQWATLPKEFQITRLPTPADRKVTINTNAGPKVVDLVPGKVNMVYVKSVQPLAPVMVWQAKLN